MSEKITRILPFVLFVYLIYTGIELWFFPFLVGSFVNVLLSLGSALEYIEKFPWFSLYPLAACLAFISIIGLFFMSKWARWVWIIFPKLKIIIWKR